MNVSSVYWSVNGDFEDWSSVGSGNIQSSSVNGTWDYNAGMGELGDLLFVFRASSYLVYRWTGDVDLPIELVQTFNYACASERTIQDVGQALIYFTGSDVRITNGNQDISIATPQMITYFESSIINFNIPQCFTLTATDNSYPFAVYDKILDIYMLFISGACYAYKVKDKKWIGRLTDTSAGSAFLLEGTTDVPQVTFSTITSTNQMKKLSRKGLDGTNEAEIFSAPLDFGVPNKRKKINYVEFTFHPTRLCNTTIGFNWWDYGETRYEADILPLLFLTDAQSYILTSQDASSNEQRVKKRFYVNENVYKFGWVLFEDNDIPPSGGVGTNGFGIIDWTVCYEITDNT